MTVTLLDALAAMGPQHRIVYSGGQVDRYITLEEFAVRNAALWQEEADVHWYAITHRENPYLAGDIYLPRVHHIFYVVRLAEN